MTVLVWLVLTVLGMVYCTEDEEDKVGESRMQAKKSECDSGDGCGTDDDADEDEKTAALTAAKTCCCCFEDADLDMDSIGLASVDDGITSSSMTTSMLSTEDERSRVRVGITGTAISRRTDRGC